MKVRWVFQTYLAYYIMLIYILTEKEEAEVATEIVGDAEVEAANDRVIVVANESEVETGAAKKTEAAREIGAVTEKRTGLLRKERNLRKVRFLPHFEFCSCGTWNKINDASCQKIPIFTLFQNLVGT